MGFDSVRSIGRVVRILRKEAMLFKSPIVTVLAKNKDPYKVLISCLLSLRTKDSTTEVASKKLFKLADNPSAMLKIPRAKLERVIFPVGFYRVKAKVLLDVSREILKRQKGKVPSTMEELLELKGVGRKTANLVLTMGYGKYGICVDTHVHRICNRLGFIRTKSPEESEFALRRKLPKRYWIEINDLLVVYGQNICRPLSPKCSICKIYKLCRRVGVGSSR